MDSTVQYIDVMMSILPFSYSVDIFSLFFHLKCVMFLTKNLAQSTFQVLRERFKTSTITEQHKFVC